MRVRILTFRYSASLGTFDTGPLDAFTRDREVLAFREHVFHVHDVPHLTCVVLYEEPAIAQAPLIEAQRAAATASDSSHPPIAARSPRAERSEDPAQTTLSESDRRLYQSLRAWRDGTAEQEGLPPFALFSNRQMAELVLRKPDSLTALGHLHGFGNGKVRRYGAGILACLHGGLRSDPTVLTAASQREPAATTERDRDVHASPGEAVGAPGPSVEAAGAGTEGRA